jgi:hypothetical protein
MPHTSFSTVSLATIACVRDPKCDQQNRDYRENCCLQSGYLLSLRIRRSKSRRVPSRPPRERILSVRIEL